MSLSTTLREWAGRLVVGTIGGPLLTPTERPPAPERQKAREDASPWHAIGGDRLELGCTGFIIQLDRRADRMHFYMHDPEGRLMCAGADLAGMKKLAEQQAGFRAEFGSSFTFVLPRGDA